MIGNDGLVYEGRGWDKKGSHTYCYNQHGYGIVFIGRYMLTTPDAVALQAYESFIQVWNRIRLRKVIFKPMTPFPPQCAKDNGKIDPNYVMCAHKDAVVGTTCPGIRGLYTWVKDHANYGRQADDGGVSD